MRGSNKFALLNFKLACPNDNWAKCSHLFFVEVRSRTRLRTSYKLKVILSEILKKDEWDARFSFQQDLNPCPSEKKQNTFLFRKPPHNCPASDDLLVRNNPRASNILGLFHKRWNSILSLTFFLLRSNWSRSTSGSCIFNFSFLDIVNSSLEHISSSSRLCWKDEKWWKHYSFSFGKVLRNVKLEWAWKRLHKVPWHGFECRHYIACIANSVQFRLTF